MLAISIFLLYTWSRSDPWSVVGLLTCWWNPMECRFFDRTLSGFSWRSILKSPHIIVGVDGSSKHSVFFSWVENVAGVTLFWHLYAVTILIMESLTSDSWMAMISSSWEMLAIFRGLKPGLADAKIPPPLVRWDVIGLSWRNVVIQHWRSHQYLKAHIWFTICVQSNNLSKVNGFRVIKQWKCVTFSLTFQGHPTSKVISPFESWYAFLYVYNTNYVPKVNGFRVIKHCQQTFTYPWVVNILSHMPGGHFGSQSKIHFTCIDTL